MESSTAGLQLASFALSQLEDCSPGNLSFMPYNFVQAYIYQFNKYLLCTNQVLGIYQGIRISAVNKTGKECRPRWGPHPTAWEAQCAQTLMGEAWWGSHSAMGETFHYPCFVLSLLPVLLSFYLCTLSVSTTL